VANDSRWIPIGPAPEDATGFGVAGGVSGRVWSIAISANFDGRNTAAMYIGIGGGAIWRSSDFQTSMPTWEPLLDHFPPTFQLSRVRGLSNIGALAVDPHNPSVIYAGSGDPDDRGANNYGQGMIKSGDGGTTWQTLEVITNPFSPGFCRIFVDPTDATGNTVYAAGAFGPGSPSRGIFKSTNAGIKWSPIDTGIPTDVAVHDIDFTVNARGALTIIAALTDAGGNDSSVNGFWQSPDGGGSWTQMPVSALTDLAGGTDQASDIGLIKLAADHTPGTPFGAFAAVSKGESLMNVFKLVNGQWTPVGASGLRAFGTGSGQAIGIAPSGEVYVGGVNTTVQNGIYWSTNGGSSWKSIDLGTNNVRPHTDHHSWAFFDGMIYNGNDGGIYRFNPSNRAWESLNTASLQTVLSQGIGIHPQYVNTLLVGSQDNGVALRTSSKWQYVTGDDDGRCKFDPYDPNFTYRTSVSEYAFFFRSDDGGHTWPDNRSVQGMPSVQDYAPFNFHTMQAGRMVLVLDRVYETRNRGDDFWTSISGQLAGAGSFGDAVAYGSGETIWASLGGRLFRSPDDGATWTELNPVANGFGGSITTIAVDPHDFNRVFVATDAGTVWRVDASLTWTNMTGNFPSELQINALALRSNTAATEPILFAASSVGVWESSGTTIHVTWNRLGIDFPDVNATDIAFNNTNKYLFAGTYGRGVFANYLHFLTDVGLGSCSVENVVFCVAKDPDERICVNQADYRHAFSGWIELQGGGQTDAPPAATAVETNIFVFIKGLDNRIYLNQAEFGHAFSGWFEVQGDGQTNSAPSAASINNHVFVFVKGLDQKVYLNQADYGHAFGNWFEVQGGGLTDASPAAATWKQTVFVFIKGLDQKIYLNQADYGHAFGNWFEVQGAGLTNAAPSACSLEGTIFVVIKGLDNKIYLNQADYGHGFGSWFELQGGGLTDAAPSICAIGKSIFVFIQGIDGRIYLNQAEYGNAFSGWLEVGGGS
jgi:hypothetical protein